MGCGIAEAPSGCKRLEPLTLCPFEENPDGTQLREAALRLDERHQLPLAHELEQTARRRSGHLPAPELDPLSDPPADSGVAAEVPPNVEV